MGSPVDDAEYERWIPRFLNGLLLVAAPHRARRINEKVPVTCTAITGTFAFMRHGWGTFSCATTVFGCGKGSGGFRLGTGGHRVVVNHSM